MTKNKEGNLDHAAVRYALHKHSCSATAGMSVGCPMSVRASKAALKCSRTNQEFRSERVQAEAGAHVLNLLADAELQSTITRKTARCLALMLLR